jgi:hypothetical protein
VGDASVAHPTPRNQFEGVVVVVVVAGCVVVVVDEGWAGSGMTVVVWAGGFTVV